MTNSHTPSPSTPTEKPYREDEIDLRQFSGALYRHKRLIGTVAGSALILSALYAFIHPTSGGPDGTGWGWTDDLNAATLNQRVADIDGVERVDVLLFHWDARNGRRVGEAQEIIRLRKNSLFLSGVHRVVVR